MAGKFLTSEYGPQSEFKRLSPYFSDAARLPGDYRKASRSFCLPVANAEENLYVVIRQAAIAYFAEKQISWHDGTGGKPSNHLCSSQVACVNFLFPFMAQPDALAQFLRPVFPTLVRVLPMEDEGRYVAFEWIGLQDYLGEARHGRRRTRGANATSADAAITFEHEDGRRHIVLIEWKYTESYGNNSIKIARSGTDRSQIYRRFFAQDDSPINRVIVPHYDDLFFQPFYQLMRQQFLAHEMEKAHELGADVVSVLHIAPKRNTDFAQVTSRNLCGLGPTATEVWKRLVRVPNRFTSVSTEAFFGQFPIERFPNLADWWSYIHQRYAWLNQ